MIERQFEHGRGRWVAEVTAGLRFSRAALESIFETGIDPRADIAALRAGTHTEASLLAHCLDGADEDREEGWRDYVEVCVVAAGQS
jgi:hypothetical protein